MGLDIHLYNVYKRIYCSLQVVLRSWSIKTKFPFPVNIGLAMLFAEHWLIQSKKISLKSAIDRVDRWIHKTTRFFHLIRKINDLTAICNLYFLSSTSFNRIQQPTMMTPNRKQILGSTGHRDV